MEKVKDVKLSKEVFGITPNDNVLTDAINVLHNGAVVELHLDQYHVITK